jgi:protein-tyrosine phosphatase
VSHSAPIIDFHAHVLPAADHGSMGILETKNQLAFYRKAGVDKVVATPHFYPNSVSIDQFLRTVDSAAAELTELLAAEEGNPRVLLGAEVLYCENMHHMDKLEKLCIRGTDVLLLELPLSEWSPALFHTVRELNKRCRVVLAHIDRYTRFNFEELWALVEAGVLVQINAFSLNSFFFCTNIALYTRNFTFNCIHYWPR